ncbi:MAG TPA: peptide deformylase [Longimicrobiales bacterium]|nr:peptide deformylase [Longimicrobiales bacterium]
MAARQVLLLGDPVLRQPAAPVATIGAETRALIADMFDTMYAEEGVGLAAPQVGVSERIIVVDPHEEGVAPFALVNPVIREASAETDRAEEGCLSIPGLKELVERSLRVVVEGLDPQGTPVRREAEGLLARILQHEIDHIDGVLFLDRVSPLKRRLLLERWKKLRA